MKAEIAVIDYGNGVKTLTIMIDLMAIPVEKFPDSMSATGVSHKPSRYIRNNRSWSSNRNDWLDKTFVIERGLRRLGAWKEFQKVVDGKKHHIVFAPISED